MIEIPLTQGKVAIVDDCDAHLATLKWHAYKWARGWYAARKLPRVNGGTQGTLFLHRAILSAPVGAEVDHINGDGLDNRRGNLRLATPAENGRNRRRDHDNRSGFKGVRFKSNGWEAYIRGEGRILYLGRFKSAEEAARAYDAAARKHHGAFARLNFSEAQ